MSEHLPGMHETPFNPNYHKKKIKKRKKTERKVKRKKEKKKRSKTKLVSPEETHL